MTLVVSDISSSTTRRSKFSCKISHPFTKWISKTFMDPKLCILDFVDHLSIELLIFVLESNVLTIIGWIAIKSGTVMVPMG